jgi:gas vesicle protein
MNNTLKNILLVTGGLAAGVITGVLTAPKSGKETREDIMNKINELKARVDGLTGEARKNIEEKINSLKKSLSEMEIEIQ